MTENKSEIENISRKEITERIVNILEPWVSDIETLGQLDDQTDFIAELGMDSVGILELILQIEKVFGIIISNDELDSRLFGRIGNFIEMIDSKLHETN
ncbi:MAG: acyl carrier protein [Planctomycetota bacterium]|jgi:acyl carrier protein